MLAPLSAAAGTMSYHIGNSITWDALPSLLDELAAEQGHEHVAGWHIACSSDLEEIWASPDYTCIDSPEPFGKYTEALTQHEWDHVTLQPWRTGGTLASDAARILDFIELARTNPANRDTRFFIYQGWARLAYFSSWTQHVADADDTRSVTARQYFEHLLDRVRSQTDAAVGLIPTGEVFYQLYGSGTVGAAELYRDGFHASYGIGRYAARMTMYATLAGVDPLEITPPDSDPELYGAILSVMSDVLYPAIPADWPQIATASAAVDWWRQQQAQAAHAAPSEAGVPEPTTLGLLAVVALVCIRKLPHSAGPPSPRNAF